MHIVQPIRSLEKIQEVKQYLMKKSDRDYFLFIFGMNSALRISDVLPLRVRDVRNKDHVWATESKTRNKDIRLSSSQSSSHKLFLLNRQLLLKNSLPL
ncbi:putative bacteriophage integrase [Bacillus velezensis]|nr:putative bacteriophage integrase [Bacillus velezensis]